MNVYALVVFAGLINWIATTILVDSTLFAKQRVWVVNQTWRIRANGGVHKVAGKHAYIWPEDTTEEEASAATAYQGGAWLKVAQLVTCHLCTGVWVGFIEAVVFGGPFGHWYAVVANGLLYKAVGHFVLELRSRLAAPAV